MQYVERLTAVKPDPSGKRVAPQAVPEKSVSEDVRLSTAGSGDAPSLAQLLKQIHLLTHVKVLVGLWIATMILAEFLPWAGLLFIPSLLGYVGWRLFEVNRASSGRLFDRFRKLAEEASRNQKRP